MDAAGDEAGRNECRLTGPDGCKISVAVCQHVDLEYRGHTVVSHLFTSAYEKGLPGLPGKSLGVGLKMVSDSKPVGEK